MISEPDYPQFFCAFSWLANAMAWAAVPGAVDDSEGWGLPADPAWLAAYAAERAHQALLFHDIFGNPFRPVPFSPEWRTTTALALARQMYESRDFSAMPILADALQDAGCENAEILDHCRGPGPHTRGCWVADLLLGKG